MSTLFTLIGVLVLALFIVVPLVERFGPRPSPEQTQKISRWILPLVGLSLVLALAREFLQ